jgi:hypothetical protein
MRTDRPIHLIVCCMSVVLIAACSKAEPTAVAASVLAPASKPHFKACDLVTAAEMSTILGVTVAATPKENDRGDTACTYAPAGASTPVLGIRVEEGAGPAGMGAAGLAAGVAPAGMVDPLQGVGEQAVHVQAGHMVMIDTGDDLMEVDYGDVVDPLPKVRRIYEISRPRM